MPTGGPRHAPWLAVQERYVIVPGSGSEAVTAVAGITPVFVTRVVNVTAPPGATGLGAADFVTPIVATTGVRVGVGVGVAVAVGVGVGVTSDPVGVGVGVGVTVGVTVGVAVGVCVGVYVGVSVGVTWASASESASA